MIKHGDVDKIMSIIDNENFENSHMVAYYYALPDAIQMELYRSHKVGSLGMKAARSYPKELDDANPYVVFNVYESYLEKKNKKNKNIDIFAAASVFEEDFTMDYDVGASRLILGSDFEEEDELVVVHQIAVQEKNKQVADICHRVTTVLDMVNDIPREVPDGIGLDEALDQKWLGAIPTSDNKALLSVVGAQAALFADVPKVREIISVSKQVSASFCLEPVQDLFGGTLSMINSRIRKKQFIRDTMRFMDVPRQWMNCPLKWGAVIGYITKGDYSEPYSMSGVDFYGAAGWKAIRIFPDSSYFDVDISGNVVVDSIIDTAIAKRIFELCPIVTYGDIFFPYASNRFLVSDAWDNNWGEEAIGRLVDLLFRRDCVIKFSCDFKMLKRAFSKSNFNRTLVVMNFGRPTSFEIFISNRIPSRMKCDDYVRHVSNKKEMYEFLDRIYERKVNCIYKYVLSIYGDILSTVYRERRPFKLRNWMIPLTAMPCAERENNKKISLSAFSFRVRKNIYMLQDVNLRNKLDRHVDIKFYAIKQEFSRKVVIKDSRVLDLDFGSDEEE